MHSDAPSLAAIAESRKAILDMGGKEPTHYWALPASNGEAPAFLRYGPFQWLGRHIEALPEEERKQAFSLLHNILGWRGGGALILLVFVCSIAALMLGVVIKRAMLPFTWQWCALALVVWSLNTLAAVAAAWFWPNGRTAAWQRISLLLPVLLLSIFAVVISWHRITQPNQGNALQQTLNGLVQVVALLTFGALMLLLVIGKLRTQRYAALNEQILVLAERERVGRELMQSQLRMMQAQIEPHFLFNTLGALQHQAEDKAPEAAALAADLIQFLRGSMHSLRTERTRLAEDFQLIEAYLSVMQSRLGARLTYALQLPTELADREVPTLMLLTLVENALKHGIEPHPPGGEVLISATISEGLLQLTVADTGRGVSDLPGSGVGLNNIRTRLKMIYGDSASLALQENTPQGFVACICIPLVV